MLLNVTLLERRETPATFTVTNTLDGAVTKAGDLPGSLRQAVFDANTLPGSDSIVFDAIAFSTAKTITFSSGHLLLSDAVSIIGPVTKLTINANNSIHVFYCTVSGKSAQPINISNLTLISAKTGSGIGVVDEALSLTNIAISNCLGGGAITLNDALASLVLNDCSITNNTSSNYGGAIYVSEGSAVTIIRSTIANNTANEAGAIRFNSTGGSLYAKDCTVSGNKSNSATGAISASNYTLENCSIVNNTSVSGPAGINGSGILRNCTVAFNSVTGPGGQGGGVLATTGGVTLESTIVAKNSGPPSSPDIYTATSVTANYSLIGNTTGATITGSNNILNVNPLLDTLAGNGGPTQTCMLLAGSPAIDKGSNPSNFDYDQRGTGYPRVLNGAPDIGAAEGVRPEPTAVATSPNLSANSAMPQLVTVQYADTVAIDLSTLGTGDIIVSGPFGFSTTPTFKSVDIGSNGSPRIAIYEFTPPNNGVAGWDPGDNGTYVINLVAGQVANTKGEFVPAGVIGQFDCYIETPLHVVKNLSDSGPGSLRQAILDSNKTSFDDTITFQVGGTITLSSDLLVSDELEIQGPGAGLVAITRTGNDGHILQTSINGFDLVSTMLTISGLTLRDTESTFAFSPSGAAIRSLGTLTIRDCVVSGNHSSHGLGAFGGAILNSGTFLAERTTFQSNYLYGLGGAVSASGNVILRDCTFNGNEELGSTNNPHAQGSALSVGGSVLIENCTFSNNSGYYGRTWGTVAVGGTVTIRNTTITNNFANSGGGLYVTSGTTTLQNCTITGNTAWDGPLYTGYGGGVKSSGTLILQSTIVSNNGDSEAPDIYALSATVQADHSAIGSLTGITNYIDNGNNLAPGTPLGLGSPGNNGGLTKTIPISAGSPAINAGSNPGNVPNDQRGTGFYRVIGKSADIGAFEYQNLPAVISSVQVNDGSPQRSLVTSLKVTFDRPVAVNANSFQLIRQSDGAPFALSASVLGSSVTLTFTGGPVEFGSLADGRYTLTALASLINGGNFDGDGNTVAGDDYVLVGSPANGLFRLFGDADGNGAVNSNDFTVFRTAFGLGGSVFDFNNDGQTNANDFAEFRKRFGLSI